MPVGDVKKRPLIGVIDDGTRTLRFVVYEAEIVQELCSHQLDKIQSQPKEGWSEQDPLEILRDIETCVNNVILQLKELGYSKDDIVTLGITNQRETTVVWDKYTGEPLYPAIVWNDIRTDTTVDAILAKIPDRNKNYLKAISGLPISPYFSALKMRWLKDNVNSVKKACKEKRALFGTVDAWIVWNLTGGTNGGLHITDVTNASRTLLMNIETLNWDPMLCRVFGIHPDLLPQIRSSSEIYGVVKNKSALDGIRISGILGNQQSALVGHLCLNPGQAKNTYRSGCFLLYNTGTNRVQSAHGLVTTVAYKLGKDSPTVYALEGSIAVAGGAMKFLRDNLNLVKDVAKETEHIASQVFSTGDVYFVPAFSGLYAPYWRKDARGIICGLTAFTTKNHIIRAALEAVCFQTRDILEAMHKDCGLPLSKLHVDGTMTSNNLLMQLQADLIGMPVLRSQAWDMTALGVAMVAGHGAGVWPENAWRHLPSPAYTFLPTTTESERDARYTKWKMAVQRSLGWATTKKALTMTGQDLYSSFMTRFKGTPCIDSKRKYSFENQDTPCIKENMDSNFFSEGRSEISERNDEISERNNEISERNSEISERKCSFSEGNDSLSFRKRSLSNNSEHNVNSSRKNMFYSNDSEESSDNLDVMMEKLGFLPQNLDLNSNIEGWLPCLNEEKVPKEIPGIERTILDDMEYFLAKKESDFVFGTPRKSSVSYPKNWEMVESLIENDPEIIFDSENKPVCVGTSSENPGFEIVLGENVGKRKYLENSPFFRLLYGKFVHNSAVKEK